MSLRAAAAPAEIGLLIYPGAQLAAVHGLTDLFGIANHFAAKFQVGEGPVLRITHWQPDAQAADVACVYDTCPTQPSRPAVVVLPPTLSDLPSREVVVRIVDWLSAHHAGGATVGSVCSGAFLLAETGIVAGRSVSTHWSCVDLLSSLFPDTEFDVHSRIIDNGDVITAGGFMAWIDLGLRLVDRLLGPTIRAETARFLMADAGAQKQSYFSGFSPRLSHGDEAILKAQHWLHGRDARDVSLATMAAQAAWRNGRSCAAL